MYSLGWERFFKHQIISVVDELDSTQIERGQRRMKLIYEIFDFWAIDRFVLKHFYESKCNLLKVSSESLRACREGNKRYRDIANAPRSTAR